MDLSVIEAKIVALLNLRREQGFAVIPYLRPKFRDEHVILWKEKFEDLVNRVLAAVKHLFYDDTTFEEIVLQELAVVNLLPYLTGGNPLQFLSD